MALLANMSFKYQQVPKPSLLIALKGTSRLSPHYQNRVTSASKDQDQRKVERAGISDLVGDGEYDASQHEMQQRSIVAFGEPEERDHQRHETGNGQYIKQGRHVIDMP
ncbi:hypothetical protein IVB05_32960 [Bradyrhizobium sp. 170]|nr:hypothetical protein [Bradyrhizobium sp. 170]UPK02365.1 hypothetical protein IVB05_32960 [Bradyrhizobium sp. 170]